MFEIQSKFQRQIEIIGLCAANKNTYNIYQLSELFKIDTITIKRDLHDIRKFGIDIHSTKKRGVCLETALDNDKLFQCITYFTSTTFPSALCERSTQALISKRGVKALSNLILINFCINRSLKAEIIYNKDGNKKELKLISPVIIIQHEGAWRLFAEEDNTLKQYILYKIIDVSVSNEKAPKYSKKKIDELFLYSWKTWVGPDRYNVKIELTEKWGQSLKAKQMMTTQTLRKMHNGNYLFEVTVNSLNEITTWILSLGQGAKVLEPFELVNKVKTIAKDVLNNYKKSIIR